MLKFTKKICFFKVFLNVFVKNIFFLNKTNVLCSNSPNILVLCRLFDDFGQKHRFVLIKPMFCAQIHQRNLFYAGFPMVLGKNIGFPLVSNGLCCCFSSFCSLRSSLPEAKGPWKGKLPECMVITSVWELLL